MKQKAVKAKRKKKPLIDKIKKGEVWMMSTKDPTYLTF